MGRYRFPIKDELSMECDCPDQTVPCKHIAAVWYAVSEKGRKNIGVFDDLL